ncbi:MAG: beta strand repeat-containing protein [Prosthecobacter sp.]
MTNILLRFLLLLLACCATLSSASAQTSLSVGDVQVLGVTADSPDSYSFVLWKDIAAGTVLRITDNSFTSTAGTTLLTGSENDMSLTFGSGLSAGTVVRFTDGGGVTVSSGTAPTASGTLSGTSNDGDQVFIYQGSAVSGTGFSGRTLLYGFNVGDTNWRSSGTTDAQSSYLPSTLNVAGASFDTDNFDNVEYSGARTGLTTAFYKAAISSSTNYGNENNSYFQLSSTGFTVNATASVYWDANGSTANNGGSGTWDTTTSDRFKNGSSGTTYFRWIDSSAGNSHTAVFAGTAGTVSVASGGVTASGLQFDTTGYTLQNNTVTLLGTTPTINVTTGTSTISSALAGSAGVTKSGNGILVLSGNNTFTGGLKVTGGTLTLGSNNALPSSTVVTLGSGTNSGKLVVGTSTSAVNITITGLATSGTGTANAVVGGNAAMSTLTILDSTSHTYNGVFGGAGTNENNINIVRTGSASGVTTLTGNSTSTGSVSVQTGTISVGSVATGSTAQPLGAGNLIQLGSAGSSSGTLRYTGGAATLDKNITALGNGDDTVQNSGTGLLTLSGTLTKNGTTLTLQGGTSGIKVTGTITGSAADSDLVVDGGAVTLENANTYNGPTYVRNGGTLNANAANALPTSPARTDVVMDDTGSGGSTMNLGTSQSAASLSGAPTSSVALGSNTLTMGKTIGTTTYGGTILGGGNIVKDGASTQVLTNSSNAYSGTTTVNGGTLQVGVAGVGKSGTGATTINGAGAVLAGTGSVEGVYTSVILGIIMPGDNGGASAGTLSTKTLIFTPASSTTVAELQIMSAASFDLLNIGGDLTLNSSSNIVVKSSGYTPSIGDSITLMDWSGLITLGGFSTGDAVRSGSNALGNEGNLDLPDITGIGFWRVEPLVDGGGLTLTVVAVPEPARGLMVLGGAMGLALRRRRGRATR